MRTGTGCIRCSESTSSGHLFLYSTDSDYLPYTENVTKKPKGVSFTNDMQKFVVMLNDKSRT